MRGPLSAVTAALVLACGSNGGIADDSGAPDVATTSDGASGDGGTPSEASTSDGGGDAGAACKRGVATNDAPGAAFAPAVAWWYDWSLQGGASPLDFVPMYWGTSTTGDPLPAGAHAVLGFNEPNFKAQSNLTPTQAAAAWPTIEAKAKSAGIPIVSPAVNFCGSSTDPSGCSDTTITDPYTWLKDFFAACSGCEVDAIAVHWYNCDLPSLKGYIDGNGSLEGFVQFGKPIWLTEFSCDGSHSEADQETYMKAAVPYLEGNPNVARYAWFSASPIPNAVLANGDGSLTPLGQLYESLAASCSP